PQHLVPLSPVFDDIAVRIHDNDAMLPSEVHSGLTDIRIVAHFSIGCFEPARRAGRCRIAKGQPADGEFDVRAELRELDLLRPLDVGQFPALQDEDTVRALGEHALPGAPRPLLVARQTRDRLRPLRRAPLARQVPSSGGGSLAPRIEPAVDCQRTKTYAAPDFGTDMSASLPLTPLAPPLWKCAPTAMVLPSLLRARALPNSSNFRLFEPLT